MIEWSEPAKPVQLISRIKELAKPMVPQPTRLKEKLSPLKGVKAVVFDVYGTMFMSSSGELESDQISTQISCMAQAFQAIFPNELDAPKLAEAIVKMLHKAEDKSREERQDQGVLTPDVEIRSIWQRVLARLRQRYNLNVALDESTIEKLIVEYQFRTNNVWPMPHLVETIDILKSASLKLGIICNAQFYTPLMIQALTGRTMAKLGFQSSTCIWSYLHREQKPSAFLFDQLLTNYSICDDLEAHEIVYIGNDVKNDIEPAQNLGFQTILFAGDKRSLRTRHDDPLYKNVKPDATIHSLRQIPDLILHA